MHSVVPQQTIADYNLYVMLFFVFLVHSVVTYLLFKFESSIDEFFGIQEASPQTGNMSTTKRIHYLGNQAEKFAMRTDLFLS
jgi:hypothetical protein